VGQSVKYVLKSLYSWDLDLKNRQKSSKKCDKVWNCVINSRIWLFYGGPTLALTVLEDRRPWGRKAMLKWYVTILPLILQPYSKHYQKCAEPIAANTSTVTCASTANHASTVFTTDLGADHSSSPSTLPVLRI